MSILHIAKKPKGLIVGSVCAVFAFYSSLIAPCILSCPGFKYVFCTSCVDKQTLVDPIEVV